MIADEPAAAAACFPGADASWRIVRTASPSSLGTLFTLSFPIEAVVSKASPSAWHLIMTKA